MEAFFHNLMQVDAATPAPAVRVYVVAGLILAVMIYLIFHGFFKKQPAEKFMGFCLLIAYAFLTAPFSFMIPYVLGSVR